MYIHWNRISSYDVVALDPAKEHAPIQRVFP